MSQKRKVKSNNVVRFSPEVVFNQQAIAEGPKRKTWSSHDLKNIKPLTFNQGEMVREFFDGRNICAHGSAGSGKTFLAIFLALTEILGRNSDVDHIIIVRSAVPTRDLGFTKGSLAEKEAVYEAPYKPIFAELVGRYSTYEDMKEAGIVEFVTTSFIRGVTWDNAIVIVDEGQSMNFHEINTIMTRMGKGSRIVFVGDMPQTDLRKSGDPSGMPTFLQVVSRMNSFSTIKFVSSDIVRGPLVKEWIIASEETPQLLTR